MAWALIGWDDDHQRVQAGAGAWKVKARINVDPGQSRIAMGPTNEARR
jgi:hypothetical protein